MTDLTPERRAELRGLAESAQPFIRHGGTDPAAVYVPAAELTALLDAIDERDRIKAELGDPSRHYIMDGWLVIDTGRHTCGTGPGGHYGAHEPGCGLEQALQLDNLQGWPGDERDRLAAQVERVRALTYVSDDGTRYGHDGHSPIDGYPECPGCWSDGILAMLNGADDE